MKPNSHDTDPHPTPDGGITISESVAPSGAAVPRRTLVPPGYPAPPRFGRLKTFLAVFAAFALMVTPPAWPLWRWILVAMEGPDTATHSAQPAPTAATISAVNLQNPTVPVPHPTDASRASALGPVRCDASAAIPQANACKPSTAQVPKRQARAAAAVNVPRRDPSPETEVDLDKLRNLTRGL